MALFRGSIENQIGTLNQVNEQIAKQKAMEQEIAMKKYLLGKEFGDDRLTGQATGTMLNPGLIPGMFSGIEDLVRSGAKKLGANVQVHERHNPVVDAELSADLLPDPEENEGEAANYLKGAQRYASGSVEDQVRAKAAQAYADAGIGFDEERFQKDFVLSNGKIKAKEDLPDHIRNQYLKTEKEFKELAGQASNKELKDEVDLRQHMKKRGIDKMKEFSGPHSNMRNQNMKYHRDLVDFYVKRKDWDKAQEVQDAYVMNEKNLDKFWGDKGRKQYDSLFQRPSRGGTRSKPILTEITTPNGGLWTVDLNKGDRNDLNYVVNEINKQLPEGQKIKATDLRGYKMRHYEKDETGYSPEQRDELEDLKLIKLEEERLSGGWFKKGEDASFNEKHYYDPNSPYIAVDGVIRKKSAVKNDATLKRKLANQLNLNPSDITTKFAKF